jgi:hypothetical protein
MCGAIAPCLISAGDSKDGGTTDVSPSADRAGETLASTAPAASLTRDEFREAIKGVNYKLLEWRKKLGEYENCLKGIKGNMSNKVNDLTKLKKCLSSIVYPKPSDNINSCVGSAMDILDRNADFEKNLGINSSDLFEYAFSISNDPSKKGEAVIALSNIIKRVDEYKVSLEQMSMSKTGVEGKFDVLEKMFKKMKNLLDNMEPLGNWRFREGVTRDQYDSVVSDLSNMVYSLGGWKNLTDSSEDLKACFDGLCELFRYLDSLRPVVDFLWNSDEKIIRSIALEDAISYLKSLQKIDGSFNPPEAGVDIDYISRFSAPNILGELVLRHVSPQAQASAACHAQPFAECVARVNCLITDENDVPISGGIGTGTLVSLLTKKERNELENETRLEFLRKIKALDGENMNKEKKTELERLEHLRALKNLDGRVLITCSHCITNGGKKLLEGMIHGVISKRGRFNLSKINRKNKGYSYMSVTPWSSFYPTGQEKTPNFPDLICTAEQHRANQFRVDEYYARGDTCVMILSQPVTRDGSTIVKGIPLPALDDLPYKNRIPNHIWNGEICPIVHKGFTNFLLGFGWTGTSSQEILKIKDLEMFFDADMREHAKTLSRFMGWNVPKLVDMTPESASVFYSANEFFGEIFIKNRSDFAFSMHDAEEGFSGTLAVSVNEKNPNYETPIWLGIYGGDPARIVVDFLLDVRENL